MSTALSLEDARIAIVAAARHLAERSMSPGSSGNLSIRVGDRVLITPTGSSLSRVQPEDLAEVLLDGSVVGAGAGAGAVAGAGPKPSKEVPLHLAAYRRRPTATAVVHLHSPYATAISCLPPDEHGHAALPNLTPYRVMRLGDVPVAPYAAPGTAELAAGVDDLAAGAAVLLLAQHGSVAAGIDLDTAVDLAEELETAAQVTLLLAGSPARELSADAVAALRSR